MRRLWGVGAKTSERLHARGMYTVGDVARVPEAALVALLGPAGGRHLHALAHNRDPRPVVVGRRRRSIGAQRALGWGPTPVEELDAVAVELVDRVARRMRSAGRVGRTVVIRMRFEDFTRATRSHTLAEATANTTTILRTVRALIASAMPVIERRGVTLLGIAVAHLDDDATRQLTLPFDAYSDGELDAALDRVRERFGAASVTRAVLAGREPGLTLPQIPDM